MKNEMLLSLNEENKCVLYNIAAVSYYRTTEKLRVTKIF